MIGLILILLLGLTPSQYLDKAISDARDKTTQFGGIPALMDWEIATGVTDVKDASGQPDGTVAWAALHIGDGPAMDPQKVKDAASKALMDHLKMALHPGQDVQTKLLFQEKQIGLMYFAAVYSPPLPIKQDKLKNNVGDPKVTLAVLDFTDQKTGKRTGLSMAVTSLVINAITAPNVRLVERQNVAKIIEAQEFSTLDVTEDSTGMFLGRLIDARYVLIGTVGQLDNQKLIISGRIVDVVTGEIVDDHRADVIGWRTSIQPDTRLLAEKMGLRAPEGMPPQPLQLHPQATPGTVESVVRAIPRGGPVELGLEIEPDQSRFIEGDEMTFRFRSDRDGYLTLLAIGPKGGITLLAPNADVRSVPVKKDQAIVIPSGDMTFRIKIEPPFGVHRIKAFVTPEPLIVPGSFDDRRAELLELARDASMGSDQQDPLDNTDWTCREIQFITAPAPPAAKPGHQKEIK